MIRILVLCILWSFVYAARECACGYRVTDTNQVYQHRILTDFVQSNVRQFVQDWSIHSFQQEMASHEHAFTTQYNPSYMVVNDGALLMTRHGYSLDDAKQHKPVSLVGIKSRHLDILHGTFRTVMKVEGLHGGFCAGLFRYNNDRSEVQGISLTDKTIVYTNQPSTDKYGNPTSDTTTSVPVSEKHHTNISVFQEHRFDYDSTDVKFFLDGRLATTGHHNVPCSGGQLELKFCAGSDIRWSNVPNPDDIHLWIKSIVAYYNTTTHQDWTKECILASGPNNKTVCEGEVKVGGESDAVNSSPTSQHTDSKDQVNSGGTDRLAFCSEWKKSAFWIVGSVLLSVSFIA